KRIEYDYDLISGNVRQVTYQPGLADRYMHRYEYDGDNRIRTVYTSKDSIIWDKDAKYFFYNHGSLARTEIGDLKVQGMDYAYTIQGWIKGVNSESLDASKDMSKDGSTASTNLNARIGQDAFGYSLGYYKNDYSSAGAGSTASAFMASSSGNTNLAADAPSLYNGNISRMVSTITDPMTGNVLPQMTAYRYDQLNRIKQLKAYADLNVATNTWGSGSTYDASYKENYTYDANGNIKTLQRNGKLNTGSNPTPLAMDNLTYNYEQIANTLATYTKNTNKLRWVDDAVGTSNYSADIDDQDINNYDYDDIGNLKLDAQEEIVDIDWTVYGKVQRVIRTTTSSKPDLEFLYDATGNRIAKIVKPATTKADATTWTTTWYTRDASSNVMATYEHSKNVQNNEKYLHLEQMVYGSSRIGTDNIHEDLLASTASSMFSRTIGNKHFEGNNHLGNVLTVVTDRRVPVDLGNDGTIDYYHVNVLSSTDYYAFGMAMPARTFNSSDYRYGFNGQEKVDEITPGHTTALFWEYDARLGRRWNLDPKPQAPLSNYACFANSPIFYSDHQGDSLDVKALYEKDTEGNLKNKEAVQQFELFASTDEGKNFLLSYAEKDFHLKGEIVKDLDICAEEEGENSKSGIDYTYKIAPSTANSPWTSPFLKKNGRLSIQTNLLNKQQNGYTGKLGAVDDVDAVTHESLLHGYWQTKRYKDGEKTDRKRIMGPDHSNDVFKDSDYKKYGLIILKKVQQYELIQDIDKDEKDYSDEYLYYNIMLPGLGYESRTDITH
ncbi:MAG: repeat protein, partial [Chitinophagaceae bacterium]|nr:repeat protein [Chitinophagaceae bacterium]